MEGKTYGYIRVSTKEQHEDRQCIALNDFGVPQGNIFMDKLSGKNFNRPAWKQLMRKLQPDDLLVVKSIDRLGRNYTEMIEQWRIITKKKQADIYVIDMPVLDTRGKRNLMTTLVADIVLVVASYFAETERTAIRQRQAEGIAAAKAKGVKFGRGRKEKPDIFPAVYENWANGVLSAREAGRRLGVSHHTFLKWVRQSEHERKHLRVHPRKFGRQASDQ